MRTKTFQDGGFGGGLSIKEHNEHLTRFITKKIEKEVSHKNTTALECRLLGFFLFFLALY